MTAVQARPALAAPPVPRARAGKVTTWPYLLVAPTIIATAYLLLYPVIRNITISLQHFRIGELIRGGADFVGFANYQEVLGDPEFWSVVPVWLSSFSSTFGTDWGATMAASTLFMLPVLLIFLVPQGRVTSGMTAGAVKG